MKTSKPRIPPLDEAQWTDEQEQILRPFKGNEHEFGTSGVYNVIGTLANHWDAYQKFGVWANHVLGETSTLPAREREILILRIGWLCQAEYEWGQHVVMGKKAGLDDEEIVRIKAGPDAAGWDPFDAALLRATDELHADAFIGDETWGILAERYDNRQMMDVVFAVGQYNMVSMLLNSLGVQLDEGVQGF